MNSLDTESNTTLTTQTLNADGTPKRPMNAFMIFARRRRPQVSSENQSMRTGEISKILSKEWNSMPPVSFIIFPLFIVLTVTSLKSSFISTEPKSSKKRSTRSIPTMSIAEGPTTRESAEKLMQESILLMARQTPCKTMVDPNTMTIILVPYILGLLVSHRTPRGTMDANLPRDTHT